MVRAFSGPGLTPYQGSCIQFFVYNAFLIVELNTAFPGALHGRMQVQVVLFVLLAIDSDI